MIPDDTPIGTAVLITRENGTTFRTKTTAQPLWFVRRARRKGAQDERRLTVMVEGVRGALDCTHVILASRQGDLFETKRGGVK